MFLDVLKLDWKLTALGRKIPIILLGKLHFSQLYFVRLNTIKLLE
jgi:hypothetical protein